MGITVSVASCVPARNTGGATPASTPPATGWRTGTTGRPGSAGEAERGVRGRQVVAARAGEVEELLGDLRTPYGRRVLRTGVAAAGPVEAGQRGQRTGLELPAEHVAGRVGALGRCMASYAARSRHLRVRRGRDRGPSPSSASAAPGSATLIVVMPIARAGLRLMPRSSRNTQASGATSSNWHAIS